MQLIKPMKGQLTVKAAAKVNLYLDVLGKRKDGYHEIESIMQSITLYDRLVFRPLKQEIIIWSDNPKIPLGKENLCYQAAELFFKKTKIKKGVQIEIHKSIPERSGLGGGSVDAAATLWGMNKLFETEIPLFNLSKLAKWLGADVPFCLKGGTSLVRGKGEVLIPLPPIRDGWLVLLDPGIPISTSWVYEKIRVGLTKKRLNTKLLTNSVKKQGLLGISTSLYNRLEEVAVKKFPLIKVIKEEMIKAGARGAAMTGSGSVIFAMAEGKEEGERILSKLKKRGRVYLVQPTDKNLKEG
ncbi:MAG: 4-(cytidine 5'-diphospho)-2-C-methyl-D-erythritol kinase [bacterium]